MIPSKYPIATVQQPPTSKGKTTIIIPNVTKEHLNLKKGKYVGMCNVTIGTTEEDCENVSIVFPFKETKDIGRQFKRILKFLE